ncbi:MAG: ribosomal L7Ae/L30e/S12e/Gadd45 family protein [Lachnospiraceae bacterium]|nr:ribosomal L7Ae/L30e/S12e/Gadd45 family protein [Lachnospiraceae bacterium]
MNNDKVLSLLGLAKKAGKLKGGEYCVETEVKKGRAKLVIVAEDASDNTKKSYTDMCSFKKVPVIFYGNKDNLGKCIGCEERAAVVLTDEGFANAVNKQISQKDIKN